MRNHLTNRLSRLTCIFLAAAFLLPTLLHSQSYNVPVGHPSYDFIERMETKGVLQKVFDESLPLSRGEIAGYLAQTIKAAAGGDGHITATEKGELEWFRREFWVELKMLGIDPEVKEEQHLYTWEDGQNHLIADGLFSERATVRSAAKKTDRFLETSGGGKVRGGLKDQLFFSLEFRQTQVNSNQDDLRKEDFGHTGYFSSRGDYGYYDMTNASGILKLPCFEFEIGKEALSWGPGERGNLTLSANPPPFDFISFRARYGAVKYSHVTGFLKTDVVDSLMLYRTPEGFDRENLANKYIACHRLEVVIPWGIDIGANESVIYGERGLDMAYLNPFMFFWSAQHHWGDQDNETMGADIEVHAVDGYSFYGAIFVDELYLKGFFNGDARNKIGYQLGSFMVDPLGLENFDLRLEYARIMPAVYSHKYPINTFVHYGETIGHWLGENGDDFYGESRYRVARNLQLHFSGGRTRRGEPAVQPDAHYDPNRFPFLYGTVERTHYFGTGVSFEPVHKLHLAFDYTYRDIENVKHASGIDRAENELTVSFDIDY